MIKRIIGVCAIVMIFHAWAYSQNCPANGGGTNYSGQNLTDYNFTTLPANALVGANFSGANLSGAQFQNVNLTNANFTGANMRRSAKGITDLSGAVLDHACFQNAQMDSANIQFAVFKATDLSNASLLSTNFGPLMTIQFSGDSIRTKFKNTTTDFNHFPINNWPAAYWSFTDLSNCRISGLNSQNFSFKGKNISGAILQGMNFSNFDFRQCVMTGADFTGATLNYAYMDSSTMDQVKLVNAKLNFTQMTGVSFYNPANTGKIADLSGAVLNNATLHRSNFSFANMRGTTLLGATADSSVFNYANFQSDGAYNVASFSGANLNYASFSSAQLNGVNFSNAYIVNGNFNNLTLMSTNFSYAIMPGAVFQQSILEGVFFTGAILQNTNFISATMKTPPNGGAGVDFSCTQLGGADFSNAIVTQANFSNAVMPVADSCCKTLDGSYCGIIAINQQGYGATVLPLLKNKVTCPNGDLDTCHGQQWVVPGWRTANCNPQHVTQIVWFKPNCGGSDTTGRITFADPNLQSCLVNQLFGGDNSKVITKNIAAQVPSLSCPCMGISNLSGLQYFTSLKSLDLSCNKLTDGTFFAQLHSLNKLKVSENKLVMLNLQGVPALTYLDASDNALTAVLLDADSYVNFLDLSYNNLSQMDISIQTALNYVDLSYNKLTNVGNLSGFSSASTIYLQNNSLKTIGNIAGIYNNGNGNLVYMNLACNLPFQCNTLGLYNQQEKDFLSHTLCGVNNLPGCNTALPTTNKPIKKNILHVRKNKKEQPLHK
jgi:uncharacterized protein YjbI with pentapeptide repeats